MRIGHLRVCGFVGCLAVLLSATTCYASVRDVAAGMGTGSLLVETAILLVVGACALTVLKVYLAVRGGRIADGWRWFGGGFGLYGIAQLVLFANLAGILLISDLWIGLLRVGALLLLLVGATRIRKLLT